MIEKSLGLRLAASVLTTVVLAVVAGCGGSGRSQPTQPAFEPPTQPSAAVKSLGKITLGLSVANTFEFMPAHVALDQGFWRKRGLDVEVVAFAGSAKLQQALAANNADLALDAAFTVIGAAAHGHEARLVAAIDNSTRLMGIVVDPKEIKSKEDLIGKVIGVTGPGAGTDILLQALSAKLTGNPQSGIKRANLGAYQNQIAALKTGQIQGFVWTLDGIYQAEQANVGKFLLSFGDELPPISFETVTATTKLIDSKPEVVKAFLAGFFEAQAYLKTHKDYSVNLFEEKMQIPKDIGARIWDLDAPALSDDGVFDPEALQGAVKLLLDAKVIESAPDKDKYLDTRFTPVNWK